MADGQRGIPWKEEHILPLATVMERTVPKRLPPSGRSFRVVSNYLTPDPRPRRMTVFIRETAAGARSQTASLLRHLALPVGRAPCLHIPGEKFRQQLIHLPRHRGHRELVRHVVLTCQREVAS